MNAHIAHMTGDRHRVVCVAHGLDRTVETEAHANNLLAKHLREQHNTTEQWPDLNLSAIASTVCMAAMLDGSEFVGQSDTLSENLPEANAILGVWESLTGLSRAEAVVLAQRIQSSREPVTAAVVPF